MIYTFYSYKGGVGRSMALANIAELLYQAGLRVLMVDWDLEAPGLERFFAVNSSEILDKPGVIDMLLEYKKKMALELSVSDSGELPFQKPDEFAIDIYPGAASKGRLWLLPAGKRSKENFANYANAVLTFDWQDFYKSWAGELYFEWLRRQFENMADVVLIDSRTGVTEMGGVCTYQFADAVIMFCSPNQQNLEGTYQIARKLKAPEVEKLRGGRPLHLFVVPARVEDRAEARLLDDFKREFQERFSDFLPLAWQSKQELFWQLKIPQVPYYAFNEVVAARETSEARSQDMMRAFSILLGEMIKLAPPDSPLKQVNPTQRPQIYDVFLSYAALDVDAVQIIAERLRENGVVPFFAPWHLVPGEPLIDGLRNGLTQSRTCAVIFGPKGFEPYQTVELRTSLKQEVESRNLRLIPITLPAADLPQSSDLPYFLSSILVQRTAVSFRTGFDDAVALRSLISGILGEVIEPMVAKPMQLKDQLQSTLLAYFSHSYRSSEKEINLFFWELLSKHQLYFTLDSEEGSNKSMDITYLEWMMQRSVCFVAVIPRRDDVTPYHCSPYQLFENNLAIRAGKPRLLFVEEGLEETIFGVQPDEVYVFRRRREWLEQDMELFAEAVERLAQKVHAITLTDSGLRKPVGLLVDATAGRAYGSSMIKTIHQIVRGQGFSIKSINPSAFEHDALLLQEIQRCSVLISEIRKPYIAPDILGLVHSQAIPMIRVCHLEKHESIEEGQAAMHLSINEARWNQNDQGDWPLIFSNYQIDSNMEPVKFWRTSKELAAKLVDCLEKLGKRRTDLTTEQEARDYFLRIGRLSGKVYISNTKGQNDFVSRLKSSLAINAIPYFHYKDRDAISIGSSDWLSEALIEVKNSAVFIALIDSNYTLSPWCMSELTEAVNLFRKDALVIYAYIIEAGVEMPTALSDLQVDFIEPLTDAEKVGRIVDNAVRFLESGEQVNLRARDRILIANLLTRVSYLDLPSSRRDLLQNAGIPLDVIEMTRTEAETPEMAATEIVDDLSKWRTKLRPRTTALGLLLSHMMGLTDVFEEQELLANLIRGYSLMPDIRFVMERSPHIRELYSIYYGSKKELGTFVSIEKGTLAGSVLGQGELSSSVQTLRINARTDQISWQKTLRFIGREIFREKVFGPLLANYEEMLDSQGIRKEEIGFCFAGDEQALQIPFEWATIKGQSSPVCLNHPVRRFLVGAAAPRLTLRMLLQGDSAVPMRVLLIASNTNGSNEADNEIDDLYSLFVELFAKVGWPESNICKLNSRAAISSRIEKELRSGHYHILHFAGRGGYDTDKPTLEVYHDAELKQLNQISAVRLRNLVTESDIRFAYLNIQDSGLVESPDIAISFQHFQAFAQALVEARIPEVIGVLWPLEGLQGRTSAQRFYREFLKGFDPSISLYRTRISFEEESRIWAAPVLIQQTDTP